MDRRTFVRSAAAASALQLLGPIAKLETGFTSHAPGALREVTVICATLFNGENWVVFSDEPRTVYMMPGDFKVSPGDTVRIEG